MSEQLFITIPEQENRTLLIEELPMSEMLSNTGLPQSELEPWIELSEYSKPSKSMTSSDSDSEVSQESLDILWAVKSPRSSPEKEMPQVRHSTNPVLVSDMVKKSQTSAKKDPPRLYVKILKAIVLLGILHQCLSQVQGWAAKPKPISNLEYMD